jgi:hypothetical protein
MLYDYVSLICIFLAKALDEKEIVTPSEPTYSAQNNVKNDLDIKLAMDIMRCQYSVFSEDQFDKNVNSCMSDWIALALSPMGKFKVYYK